MIDLRILIYGFDPTEYGLIDRILKVISFKDNSMHCELVKFHTDSPDCIIINHDKDNTWFAFVRELRKVGSKACILLISNESVQDFNYLQRPLTVKKLTQFMEEMVKQKLGFSPDLVIGQEDINPESIKGDAYLSPTKQKFSQHALVVDDSEAVLKAMTSALNLQQISVDAVSNPKDVLGFKNIGFYNIIFLDVMMPEMDGYELAKEIRKIDATIPIVMLTSKNSILDKVKATLAGSNYFLTKPITSKELVEILEKFNLKKN